MGKKIDDVQGERDALITVLRLSEKMPRSIHRRVLRAVLDVAQARLADVADERQRERLRTAFRAFAQSFEAESLREDLS